MDHSLKARNSYKHKTDDSQFAFQEEFQMEGIDWSFQNFVDNRACLDLIEPKKDKCLLYNSHFTSPRFKVKTTCLACITLPGACLTKSKDSSRKTRLGFVSKQVTSTDADHVPRTLA